jgi:hypothetical protein
MKFRMTKVLRFWVDHDYEQNREHYAGRTRSERIAGILVEFEEAGDAMRYLNGEGRIAWKASPQMLRRLADAERDAKDDFADWP